MPSCLTRCVVQYIHLVSKSNLFCKNMYLIKNLCCHIASYNKCLIVPTPYLVVWTSISLFHFKVCIFNAPYAWSTYKGSGLGNLNQKICIECHNHNTSLYWMCEGHASHVPMQPTNKHLRISYEHKVNNSMTQLLFMSHTLNLFQMHQSISNHNTH